MTQNHKRNSRANRSHGNGYQEIQIKPDDNAWHKIIEWQSQHVLASNLFREMQKFCQFIVSQEMSVKWSFKSATKVFTLSSSRLNYFLLLKDSLALVDFMTRSILSILVRLSIDLLLFVDWKHRSNKNEAKRAKVRS